MPNARLILVLVAALLSLAPQPGAVARVVQAPNTHVLLDLPDSFEPQERYGGFLSKDAGATVMVLDLPLYAYQDFTQDFDKDLRNKGYSDIRREQLPGRDDEHLYFYARQHTPVGQFDKYLLVLKNAERAAYVTITVNPVEKVETPLSYIEATNILSAIRLTSQTLEAPPPYELGYLGPFRLSGRMIGATGLYVLADDNETGSPDEAGSGRPMFVVTPSLSQRGIADLKKVGRDLMFKFSRLKDIRLAAEEDLTVAGMKGYGLSATALRKSDGAPVGLYQLLLAQAGGGYYRLVGVAPKDSYDKLLDEFRRMAASLKLTGSRR
jgi:hypothetical protein